MLSRSSQTSSPAWLPWVLHHTGAAAVMKSELLQNLWSGYGELLRLTLRDGSEPSVILKRVVPPELASSSASDSRKRRSYAVEQAWYRGAAGQCDEQCRVARCFATDNQDGASYLLLEDLGASGFHPTRPPRSQHLRAGLSWLAHFHARFCQARPDDLWAQGNYWHLDTRQDELRRMPDGPLKKHAADFDRLLKSARYQTLLHGDSKPANFLWHTSGSAAAVDFQYVGPGCGIRDVVYFMDSCLGESGCEAEASEWLDVYFAILRKALHQQGHGPIAEHLEDEWRALYPVAWSDFCRFEQGWGSLAAPGSYSQSQITLALGLLK